VDHLKHRLFREVLSYLVENPSAIARGIEWILVSRNLERVADLATNVAEEVVFIAEARVVKHHLEERHAP
jgi:phosphate transport system protein